MSERPPYRLPRNVIPRHYALVLEPDLGQARFDGEASIDVDVVEDATEIVMNAAELEVASAELSFDGKQVVAAVSMDPEEEQVVLRPQEPVPLGPCQVRLKFSGHLNDKLRGFYRSKYKAQDGTDQWLAVTQFESTDARRAFPCWDEPDFKATFGMTVVADEGLTVLSNGQLASSEPTGDGKRRACFADTIKMSTYLVAVAVGPFQMTQPVEVAGVPLRVGFVPGRAELTGLAQKAAVHALDFLRDYFSIPYPAEKLDHIAIPDFAAGAMENLGLVTYRETALLVPEDSSQAERQRVVTVVAHETAHMWFGDLVTMKWWEGTWLNEAFATFMEMLVTDAFEPSWQIWANFGVDRVAALATDSLRNTRAIEYPVGRPDEAEDMFDIITYEKGGSVLRMLERYLGGPTFRQGLSYYLDEHKFANTVTTDLWDALEHVSGQPLTATMTTWVNQPGHPAVTAEMASPTTLRLSQRRFMLDGSEEPSELWVVPLTLRYATADGSVKHVQALMDKATTTIALEAEPEWVLVNESAWGVYRSHYAEPLRSRLFGHLDQLDERERLSLVADMWTAAIAGHLPLDVPVQLWRLLSGDKGPDLWWTISSGLGLLGLVCEDGQLPGVRDLARDLAGPTFRDLGWGSPGAQTAAPREAQLRARLVTLLGTLGAGPEVRAEARRLLKEADEDGGALPPDLATAVAHVVAADGGPAEWDDLYARHKMAKTPQDETRYLMALASFEDPQLLQRTAELVFSGDVRVQDAPFLLGGLLSQRRGAALGWRAIESHWDEMSEVWPSKLVLRALESLPGLAAAGEEVARRALDWLDSHPIGLGSSRLAQSEERLRINLGFGRRVSEELARVLAGPAAQRA